MTTDAVIQFHDVQKHYGPIRALDTFTAEVRQGRITAFLGANGSGKTTSLRVLLGLSRPDDGVAHICGRPYADLVDPLRTVGAVIDQGLHPNRSALNTLRLVAMQAGVPDPAVDELLATVGLTDAARRRVGGFSLGMRQRLILAAALIARPTVLVMDEPFNGLDPEGISSMRALLRKLADDGGTVLLSSHLLAEVAHSVDDIIIDAGRLVSSGPIAGLAGRAPMVLVTTPDAAKLAAALDRSGAAVQRPAVGQLRITGLTQEQIGRIALGLGLLIVDIHAADGGNLEAVFTTLVAAARSTP